jgi:hypothetical protein
MPRSETPGSQRIGRSKSSAQGPDTCTSPVRHEHKPEAVTESLLRFYSFRLWFGSSTQNPSMMIGRCHRRHASMCLRQQKTTRPTATPNHNKRNRKTTTTTPTKASDRRAVQRPQPHAERVVVGVAPARADGASARRVAALPDAGACQGSHRL